jgi:hypothetical protein
MDTTSQWVIEETKGADFRDKRLTKRFENLLEDLSKNPAGSIPQAFKTWGETLAAYRFFDQEFVTPEKILRPHYEATLERVRQEKIILVLQDTSEIDFSHRKPIPGMGPLSFESQQGFYLHPSLAVTPERVCLGVLDAKMWSRESLGKSASKKQRPFEEKESYRWLEGYEIANEVANACSETMVVNVADREADIYELLMQQQAKGENKAHWLIRSEQNRLVFSEEDSRLKEKLWEKIKSTDKLGEIEFTLPRAPERRSGKVIGKKTAQRKERTVVQEVRATKFKLVPPKRSVGPALPSVTIYAVHCIEVNPSEEEAAIEWFLLTSVAADKIERVLEIIQWYLCRWQIEIFFKILKSGCKIEELQFDNFSNTSNCIALYMIIAWRILYLTMLGRACPELSCDMVFEDCEWKSVYMIVTKKEPPDTPPLLDVIIRMIASLGGFLGRKQDGYPGPKVMWIGIQRMRDFSTAWEIFRP